MPLNGITLLKGTTGMTPVGGTATVYNTDSADVKNGIHVVDNTEANFLLRPHLTFKNKPHSPQADGSYSKGVRNTIYTQPKILASTKITYNVGRVTLEIHPESTAAEIAELRRMTAQSILDSEADDFVIYGSTK